MSSSSSSFDSYSAPSHIPSPQELSHLLTEPDSLQSIAHQFTSKPTSTAILRHYAFLSHSIAQLEEELERHQMEREVIYDHLFDNQSFRTRIRPIVNEYRKRGTLTRQGFHPYSRTSGSPIVPSADNSPSTNNRPSIEMVPSADNSLSTQEGIHGRISVEIHDRYTPQDDALGSKEHPIIVTDDEKEEYEGCRGDHEFRSCTHFPQPYYSLKVQESR
jgi:hypothetical protein